MDCYCASSTLYKRDKLKSFKYLSKKSSTIPTGTIKESTTINTVPETNSKLITESTQSACNEIPLNSNCESVNETNRVFEEYPYIRNEECEVHDWETSRFRNIYIQNIEHGGCVYPSTTHGIESIDYADIVADPMQFYKDFISTNKPCKILNATSAWPAMSEWKDLAYLRKKLADTPITIDVTPDGFADSIYNKFFAQPKQVKGTFDDFLAMKSLKNQGRLVPYIQKQNNNLLSEFAFLLPDVSATTLPPHSKAAKKQQLPDLKTFFKETFFGNQEPEAINFWMGYSDSVSALHKDPYENIYAVIQGEKHFTLGPPSIMPFVGRGKYENCKWNCTPDFSEWWLEPINTYNDNSNNDQKQQKHDQQDNEGSQESTTVWSAHNPDLAEDFHRHFEANEIPIYHVTVCAGEVLYLPSLWYHQVTQFTSSSHEMQDTAHADDFIIAANFWYDMQFDQKFQLVNLLTNLIDLDVQENQKNNDSEIPTKTN